MNRFKGKVAIVTGGASGIGRALCKELCRRSCTVIVADIDRPGAEHVAATMREAGGQASHASVDVTRASSVQQLVAETVSQHGRLDYMFNNAGIGIAGELREMQLEQWQRVIDVNLWSVIHGTRAAYQVMLKQGFGHIVNTASGAGLFPAPVMGTAYTMSKHAVVGLSMALRSEAAGSGVKVSVICPAVVQTGIFDAMIIVGVQRERIRAAMTSLGMMTPDKCARVILSGVDRNQAIVPIGFLTHLGWYFYRHSPYLYDMFAGMAARIFRTIVKVEAGSEIEERYQEKT